MGLGTSSITYFALSLSLYVHCFVPYQQTDDGEDDLKKGTQLLEIYALEIQMYTAQKNNKKLKVGLPNGPHWNQFLLAYILNTFYFIMKFLGKIFKVEI